MGIFILLAGAAAPVPAAPTESPTEPVWTDVVRDSPYWASQGVFTNILTIRRWVLGETAYCSEQDRHILFDMRGRFLTWLSNGPDSASTQARLNDIRQRLAEQDRTDTWVAGGPGRTGYPFALACDQPHANLAEAVGRYLGTRSADRLWGAWDDLTFATRNQPGSLHEALLYVYQRRQQQGRPDLPPAMVRYLAGQILIESGGRTRAHSTADARGILQLTPTALADCEIRPANHWHRLAQIDCALRLTQQNARNVRPAFDQRFGHLPEAKQRQLFSLLLVQAYHGGAARVASLLTDDELSRPAAYFADHHARFSAGDIAFGLIFHNLGRDRFGLASLYYVADVQLATEALCRTSQLKDTEFCTWN